MKLKYLLFACMLLPMGLPTLPSADLSSTHTIKLNLKPEEVDGNVKSRTNEHLNMIVYRMISIAKYSFIKTIKSVDSQAWKAANSTNLTPIELAITLAIREVKEEEPILYPFTKYLNSTHEHNLSLRLRVIWCMLNEWEIDLRETGYDLNDPATKKAFEFFKSAPMPSAERFTADVKAGTYDHLVRKLEDEINGYKIDYEISNWS